MEFRDHHFFQDQHFKKALKKYRWEELVEKYKLKSAVSPCGSMVILNYDHVNGNKFCPVADHCRCLVLQTRNNKILAKGFPRFYNWGENTFKMSEFRWEHATVHEKIDGSYMQLFYANNRWHITTRGSWAQGTVEPHQITWKELFEQAVGMSIEELGYKLYDRYGYLYTFVFELVSPFNKIVRDYGETAVYILGALSQGITDRVALVSIPKLVPSIKLPKVYKFTHNSQILNHLKQIETTDPTFEGFVAFDGKYRWKFKSLSYFQLHKAISENKYHPKTYAKYLYKQDGDELLNYVDSVAPIYDHYNKAVKDLYKEIKSYWRAHKDIQDQKEFAQAILNNDMSNWSWVLFEMRKQCSSLSEADQDRHIWEIMWQAHNDQYKYNRIVEYLKRDMYEPEIVRSPQTVSG